MREIKYRGQATYNNEWVYGDLSTHYLGGKRCDISYQQEDGNWITWMVDPVTVGQYVPKEGFYEGDILGGGERDEYGTLVSRWFGVVKYDETTGRIRIEDDCGEWYETDDYMYDRVIGNIHDYDRVIGNIHDNPELLEAPDEN